MYLTTCNNCGLVWEDPNPGNESIEYKEFPFFDKLGKDGEGYWCCQVCKTDGHLCDNINWEAMTPVQQIVVRKKLGADCTEEESAELKGWMRDTIIQVETKDAKMLSDIQIHFPLEYGEYLDENVN